MLWVVLISVSGTLALTVLAMNFATPEKKIDRKVEHRYGIADPQFRLEMSVMVGPSITAGNHVVALQNGAEIFPAMLAAIRGAQTSITFETYIYWSGDIGQEFSDALSERARAGIPVKVMIDWVGSSRMDRALLRAMEEAGVEMHRYRPLRWYNLGRMNNRTHRKLLVVDGKVGFTGGVGIADPWQGNAEDPEHWRDMHFQVEGPVVAQFQAAFNDNWIKTTGDVLNTAVYFTPLTPSGALDAQLFIASPASGSESMHLMYLMAIAAAEHTIDLATPYFVPDRLVTQAIVAARRRGVHVRILLPGPHSDSDTVRLSSKGGWGGPARGGSGDAYLPEDDDALKDAHRGPGAGLGGVDEFRYPFVPAQRRGEPEHLRPRFRAADDRGVRGGPSTSPPVHLSDVEGSTVSGEGHREALVADPVPALKIAPTHLTFLHRISRPHARSTRTPSSRTPTGSRRRWPRAASESRAPSPPRCPACSVDRGRR